MCKQTNVGKTPSIAKLLVGSWESRMRANHSSITVSRKIKRLLPLRRPPTPQTFC
ncbi:hypothetical protein HanIR_Chr09g0443461 [Helianthus annuus]|nr:hypothetical protein HanIR_Chr09g0443461 [Helianthus annuus]